jgi:DNA-binding HxlR family transcriptional regulator
MRKRAVRPGEDKMLTATTGVAKSFGELQKETGLSPRILSTYLKNLQKLELIERNIDNRKYMANKKAEKVLVLVHKMESIENQLRLLLEKK